MLCLPFNSIEGFEKHIEERLKDCFILETKERQASTFKGVQWWVEPEPVEWLDEVILKIKNLKWNEISDVVSAIENLRITPKVIGDFKGDVNVDVVIPVVRELWFRNGLAVVLVEFI